MNRAPALIRPPAVAVLLLAGLSWWFTVGRMAGMESGPTVALGSLGWFAVTWLLMMAAMMLPAIAPAVAARWRAVSQGRSRLTSAALFVAGYLAVWAAIGVVAYLALRAGHALAGHLLAWHRGGRWLVVAVLGGSAVYQVTAVKRRWLSKCHALAALDAQPGVGPAAAVQTGVRAGLRCVASSAGLMAVLFALGVMSVVWMAAVAALVAAERLLPLASPARIAAAAVLLALAIGVAASPGSVPGFVLPASHGGAKPMMSMSGG